MFRHRRGRKGGDGPRFSYKPSRRRWWWQKPEPFDEEEFLSERREEQLWRVAWWQQGWGVWPGDADPLTTPPVYTTANIPIGDSQTAMCWAAGVVPPNPLNHLRCSYRGDPAAPF
ncbi:hypothetical protein [Nonomuraea candida]|uniref:hypothetical protein n=1 Tax=Nonomuraea candida TaxID=359159 RepID=UPI0005B95E11|nr:hypothetical protein [Nonomuraea candida]